MKTDEKFSKIVYDIMDEEVIQKFKNREGRSEEYYELEEEKDV